MSESTIGNWALTVLAGIAVGVVAGLGSAMAWFRESKQRIYARITTIEDNANLRIATVDEMIEKKFETMDRTVERIQGVTAAHDTQLAVFQANLLHISEYFNELRAAMKDNTRAIQELGVKLKDDR